ncbi:hypothetical protein A6V36_01695 [Paraburkholderia ginsengiterrae]|uniref:Resolvase/invertase-type recombinase catalytic domain-containing protein n=1 Tax=Paraburkholderia ginsengiterrae TaxID=1462993 RepID=A0A1A9ND68_9BURK|nr:hypothetical protein A6V36_01695 [Paraburkholderia ginsengiterrae]OAJ64088.1 hypothetical protein A6V37_00890 [Paraburkholderia ginsengiterrae]
MPIRAAQYIRMSTDHQQYSPVFQRQAIADYSARHGIRIVCEYEDEGISGLTLQARPGLSRLLVDVADPARKFSIVLVYDVSRWGRFQDVDEAAFYEYTCRRAGVRVVYVAEPFEDNDSPAMCVMKALKRAMASEFSRELSRKVFLGHCLNVQRGYHCGGPPGYGLQRVLHDGRRGTQRTLDVYEYKNLQTDRVSLAPGPLHEIGVVRKIFEWYAWQKLDSNAIANRLNGFGICNRAGRPWRARHILQMLHNEKYIGTNVYSRTSSKLAARWEQLPEEEWVRVPHAFEAIVDAKTFAAVRRRLDSFHRVPDRAEILAGLRKVVASKGRLSQSTLRASCKAPSVECVMREFGSLNAAYREIGYAPNLDPERSENRDIERRVETMVAQVTGRILAEKGHQVHYEKHSSTLCIDAMLRFQIVARCPWTFHRKEPCWVARWPDCFDIDFMIYCRLPRGSAEILDFFVLPYGSLPPGEFTTLQGRDRQPYRSFRHADLRLLIEMTGTTGLEEVSRLVKEATDTTQVDDLPDGHAALAAAVMQIPALRKLRKGSCGRLPVIEQMKSVMNQQCKAVQLRAENMRRFAVQAELWPKLLLLLATDADFVHLLKDLGMTLIPVRVLAAMAAYAGTAGNAGTSHRPITESPDAVTREPDGCGAQSVHQLGTRSLSVRTSKALKMMSGPRRDTAIDLMYSVGCYSGDFATALLAATPKSQLAEGVSLNAYAAPDVRTLVRTERRLGFALTAVRYHSPTHDFSLTETAIYRAYVRRLLSNAAICGWLDASRPELRSIISELTLPHKSRKQPRRPMKVAG